MALAGKKYGTFSGRSTSEARPSVTWTATQNIEGNYSDVTITLWYENYGPYFAYNNSHPVTFNVDGNSSSANKAFDCRNPPVNDSVWTRTVRVYHNADGTKTFDINVDGDTETSWGNSDIHTSDTLDTIPREANISSAGNLTIGNNYPFSVNNDGDLYIKARLYVWNGSSWVTVKTQNMGTPQGSTTITLGTTENNIMYQAMPNTTSRSLRLTIWTYSDSGYSNQVGGTDSDDNTVYVNQTTNKPTFSDFDIANVDKNIAVIDKYSNTLVTSSTSTLLGSNSKVIKGYSKVRATVAVADKMTALNYATEDHYRLFTALKQIEADYSDIADVTLDLDNIQTKDFSVSAYDSRSLATTVNKSLDYLAEYSPVNLWGLELVRDNGVDSPTKLQFSGSFWKEYFGGGTAGVQNTATVHWRYKLTTESWGAQTWNAITPTDDGSGNLTYDDYINGDLGASGFDSTKSFDIEVRLYDKLSVKIVETTLSKGTPLVDFTSDKVSIGGRVDGTKSGVLQVQGGITLVDKTIDEFLDEDNFASNSASAVASQQSIKALVDGVQSSLNSTDSSLQSQINSLDNLIDLGGVDAWSSGSSGYILFKGGFQIAWIRDLVTLGGNMWNTETNVWYSDHYMGNWARSFNWMIACVPAVRVPQYWAAMSNNASNTSGGTVRAFRPNANTASGYVNVIGIGSA